MTPGKGTALIAPRKHEKSQGPYHHRYMVTRAILAKVCRCKPNRRSRGYPDLKQGGKLLKVNYFPSGCIGVGFSTSRCRARSVTVDYSFVVSVTEIIEQIKALPPNERAQVAKFVVENDDAWIPESFKEGMANAEAGRFVDLDTALTKPYPGDQ